MPEMKNRIYSPMDDGLYSCLTENSQMVTRLFTTKNAAKYLSVSEHWLKKSRFDRSLDGPLFVSVREGQLVRYDIFDLNSWIEGRKFRGTHEYSTPRIREVRHE